MAAPDLDSAIGDRERILLDSSLLIAFHTPIEAAHPLAVQVLRRIEREADSLHGYVSAVSAAEILVRPLRTSAADFTFMHEFLTGYPNLTLLPVDLPVATQAATLRALSGASLPDALVVASGLLAGCEAIVSNDERWKRRLAPLFPQFHWIHISDYL